MNEDNVELKLGQKLGQKWYWERCQYYMNQLGLDAEYSNFRPTRKRETGEIVEMKFDISVSRTSARKCEEIKKRAHEALDERSHEFIRIANRVEAARKKLLNDFKQLQQEEIALMESIENDIKFWAGIEED